MMQEPVNELQPFERAMVVIAHPDDAEFMAAGTVATWTRQGKQVVYVVCTNGDKGSSDPEMVPARLATIREAEQRAACAALGVSDVVFLEYPDQYLQNTLELRRDIARQIRRFRPDVVICQDPVRHLTGRFLNHPDHRNAGDATLDAVFPSARDYHAFPELIAEGFMPHKALQVLVGMGGGDEANLWIDISESIDQKIEAVRQHKSQFTNTDGLEERVKEGARRTAGERGMQYAEAFRYLRLR
ncbi:MAG: PIG-L family deacetylase [Dehalococcoidia bacterium]|nr:PIG-L family deacetylase [Dehalococcoidia bacterium]